MAKQCLDTVRRADGCGLVPIDGATAPHRPALPVGTGNTAIPCHPVSVGLGFSIAEDHPWPAIAPDPDCA